MKYIRFYIIFFCLIAAQSFFGMQKSDFYSFLKRNSLLRVAGPNNEANISSIDLLASQGPIPQKMFINYAKSFNFSVVIHCLQKKYVEKETIQLSIEGVQNVYVDSALDSIMRFTPQYPIMHRALNSDKQRMIKLLQDAQNA